jgi:hypothetical protein
LKRYLETDQIMSNIVSFRKAQQARETTLPSMPEAGPALEISSLITGLQSKAKEEIHHSILMLDLAARHAREIGRRLNDPAMKQNFNAQVKTIEHLIRLAQDMAAKL